MGVELLMVGGMMAEGLSLALLSAPAGGNSMPAASRQDLKPGERGEKSLQLEHIWQVMIPEGGDHRGPQYLWQATYPDTIPVIPGLVLLSAGHWGQGTVPVCDSSRLRTHGTRMKASNCSCLPPMPLNKELAPNPMSFTH